MGKRGYTKRVLFLNKSGIPLNSENEPWAYIFQRPFLRAYVRREICVSKPIGLACSGKEIYHFCFVLLCIRRQIPSTSPPPPYIRRGDLTEGFLRYDFGGLIFAAAYSWRGLFSGILRYTCKRVRGWTLKQRLPV